MLDRKNKKAASDALDFNAINPICLEDRIVNLGVGSVICAFDECGNNFEPHRHNQKYCCPECCKGATNKRIRDKYYETKKRLSGDIRVCSRRGCKTILSRYSENEVCSKCSATELDLERKNLLRIFGV